MATHSERCADCKKRVHALLEVSFGEVKANYDLRLPSRADAYKTTRFGDVLERIFLSLQRYRGYDGFVRSKKLPRVDFFVPSRGLIIEFDESQHFTQPRELSLSLYPVEADVVFSIERWRRLCEHLNKKDNDPPFRDEQRAWYDTLRDFAPVALGAGRTLRLYARDIAWCSLSTSNSDDLYRFGKLAGFERLPYAKI